MSFPTNPVNGQTTVTNNITYVYNSSGTGYWTRVYFTTSTLIGTQSALNIANTTQSVSSTTGALVVAGGVGVAGNINFSGNLYQNGVLFTGGGGSSTGTTSTFVILNTTQSTTTATGALQVRGGAGIGLNLNVGGTITAKQYFDSADTANFILWPTNTSFITGLSAQGPEVTAGNASLAGAVTVTRTPTSTSNYTFYGLYNAGTGITAGIGLDNSNNLWFGGTTGGTTAKRSSLYFYTDNLGNVYANSSFRSDMHYAASNSAYYLNFIGNTTTNNTIMATGISSDLIGYNLSWGPYFGGVGGKYITAGSTATSGPLWISTGTPYTIIHSGNVGQYAAQGGSSFTTPVSIKFNNNTATSTTTAHLSLINPNGTNTPILWQFGNNFDVRASIRANASGDLTFNSLSGNFYFQQDFGSSSTNFSNSTTVFMGVDGSGNITHPGSITATRLIDRDDPTYFLDPNSTSTVSALTVKGQLLATYSSGTTANLNQVIQASPATGGSFIVANRAASTNGQVGYGWGTGATGIAPQWTNYLTTGANFALFWDYNGVTQLTLNANSNALQTSATGQMNSPVYYDISNSAFYVKPSGYSYLGAVQVTGGTTGITTGTGVRVFQNGGSTVTSTLYWGNTVNTYGYNWQLDTVNNAALWSINPALGTWTQILTVSPNGNLGVNQNTLPGDISMYGGISINGTGTTQLSLQRAGVSGLSARISDVYAGDFSLYDKGTGAWTRAINASRGFVGINTGSTSTYSLTAGIGGIFAYGPVYATGFANSANPSQGINFGGTTNLQAFNANSYGWYGTTSTGYGVTLNNTFETAAVVGGDPVIGSGTMMDFFAYNKPDLAEYFGGVWFSTAIVPAAFTGKNGMNFTPNYTLSLFQPAVRFTWNTFGLRSWDALLISGNTRGITLTATFETSINSGATWTTINDQLPLGSTSPSGYNYLRVQNTNAGQYFRVTIRGTFASASINADIGNISLYGGYQQAQRLLDWDYARNITTYGNMTTGIHYDKDNTAFFVNAKGTSTLYSATLTNDISVAGQGRFGGWVNGSGTLSGLNVEVGVQAGQAIVSSFNRNANSYGQLTLTGSPISINPQANKAVNIGGTWYDGDNPTYFVKPSASSNIFSLTTNGPVQMVNLAGSNYNENLRLPRATDGYSQISMATDTSGSGNTAGQWNLTVYPASYGGYYAIRYGATDTFRINTNNDNIHLGNHYAPIYYGTYNNGSPNTTYYLAPDSTSNLNILNIKGYSALNVSPNDDYGTNSLNTYTYVHASVGVDTIGNLNDTVKLPYQSVVGSMNVTNNAPGGVTGYYTLYQARHRGGYSDGNIYGSQIVIGMTGPYSNLLFYRNQSAGAWQSWQEPIINSLNTRPYTIYASILYDQTNPAYYVQPASNTRLSTLTLTGALSASLSGTPTSTYPYLGSSEWVKPAYTTTGLSYPGGRLAFRDGLYSFAVKQDPYAPYTGGANYWAGLGFGAGTQGGAELAANFVNIDSQSRAGLLYIRTLRDSSTGWTSWYRILNQLDDPYAGNMDQYVRTTDSPTFSNLTITNTPAWNNITANSFSIRGGGSQAGMFVMPWNGAGYGALGTYNYSPYNQAFRFDQVNGTSQQQSFVSSANISMYLGGNLTFYQSGQIANHNTIYPQGSTSYYLQVNSTSNLYDTRVDTLTLSSPSAPVLYSTAARTRGLLDPSYAGGAPYGNIATYGTGLNSWQGFTSGQISWMQNGGAAGMYDASQGHWILYSPINLGPSTAYIGLNGSTVNSAYNVYVSGSVYATGNVYAYSDRRKKRDIATVDNALDKVLKLRGVYYYRIDPSTESDIDRRDLGVIAQEVLEVIPEVVKYAGDEDGYSVNYGNLAGLFIEAIKDLKKELDEVKAELTALKTTK
jgi:Chaperone of endosialidase